MRLGLVDTKAFTIGWGLRICRTLDRARSPEFLVLLEKLFDLILKGFRGSFGHLFPEVVEDTIGEAIQSLALLIPVVLKGSRMKVTDDAGDVNIISKIFREREDQR